VTLCIPADYYQCSRKTYCLYLLPLSNAEYTTVRVRKLKRNKIKEKGKENGRGKGYEKGGR
jgi:hypothetical protein